MKNWTTKITDQALAAAVVVAVGCLSAACTKGGSVTSGDGSSTATTGTVTATLVYPTSQGSSWTPIKQGLRFFIKGLNVTIEGTCSPGIDSIKVHEGVSPDMTDTATCLVDGSWTLTAHFAAGSGVGKEGPKTLTFTAYDAGGLAVSGGTTTVDVQIDATVPTQPVITNSPVGGSPPTPNVYDGSVNDYDLTGTCETDVDHLLITGTGIVPASGISFPQAAGTWDYTLPLTPGGTSNFTIVAFDVAGNMSSSAVQTIIYHPNATLIFGNFSGGTQTDGGTGMKLEASHYFVPDKATDGSSSMSVSTGFNAIINKVREQ